MNRCFFGKNNFSKTLILKVYEKKVCGIFNSKTLNRGQFNFHQL